MFEVLFIYPKVLARHQQGPAAVERERYLAHCAAQGAARTTLRRNASALLVIAERIDVTVGKSVTQSDIDTAAGVWARQQRRRRRAENERWPRQLFSQVATAWLRFLRLLEDPPHRERNPLYSTMDEFTAHQRTELGFSPITVRNKRWHIERFLDHVSPRKSAIASVTLDDIDDFLEAKGRTGWCRVSVASSAKALRSFFRYAEKRRWCSPGIAAAIDAPRIFHQEGLPRGPDWHDVGRLIESASGSSPRDVRDHAILMLLAVYGLRSGEVSGLRLKDLDWDREVITIRRPKQRRTQYYPLVEPVGTAILKYIHRAGLRHCGSRYLFVTLRAPIRRMSAGGLYHVVRSRLRALGIASTSYGPHGLRHACAAHLVSEGLSLKEVGDHLGHRSPYATRMYARVDLMALRQVAEFDLGGLS